MIALFVDLECPKDDAFHSVIARSLMGLKFSAESDRVDEIIERGFSVLV